MLKELKLSTKIAERRNELIGRTDSELITLFKKHNSNFELMAREEKIQHRHIARIRLRKLGYFSSGGPRGQIAWNSGLTKHTHASLKSISDKLKEGHASGRLTNVNANLAQGVRHTPITEIKIIKILNELRVKYVHLVTVGKLLADFAIGNKVIEVDGCYWHKCPSCFAHKFSKIDLDSAHGREEVQDEYYTARGFSVLHIWEHELKDLDAVKTKIVEYLK